MVIDGRKIKPIIFKFLKNNFVIFFFIIKYFDYNY